MTWTHDYASFPGAAAVGARTEQAMQWPLGVVSPLWPLFGAAASCGVAYWWMTQWTRAVNIEALALPATLQRRPVEIAPPVAAAAPAVEAVTAAPSVESQPEPSPEAEPAPEPVVAAVDPVLRDDLTAMTGIGPKLEAALFERGVMRYAQIAAWTAEDLAEVDAALNLKGRATREAWVAQAKRLAGQD